MKKQSCSRAMAYYRLSKEDKSKAISDSIENQRKLIREYIERHENISLVREVYDDGYTGTNYNRPGFVAVMEAVEAGEIDCLIVKDLSRLGREYIETGTYLEKIFPALGIRFIAINDDYDTDNPKQSDSLMVPMKNLMNETYCRDLSNKLRRQFVVQRNNGEWVGPYVSYGYCKDPEDKHRLIVDEYAAGIVREIFQAKVEGYSQVAIANTLNAEGILAPSEYKKQYGINYKSGFQTAAKAAWCAPMVTNILKNRIYVGDLIQGKRGTPNFKIKVMRERKQEEWSIVENNHEAIIDPLLFEAVQKVMSRDTRRSPKEEALLPLAGVIFCADCERSMVRRSVTRAKKKFFYYVCSTNKRSNGCSSHSIEQTKLETAVLNALRMQIKTVVELDVLLTSIQANSLHTARMKKVQVQIQTKEKELDGYKDFKSRLIEALNDDLIDRDEFTMMRDKYRRLEEECSAAIESLYQKLSDLSTGGSTERSWVEQYAKYQDLTELSREAVVALIDKVKVYDDKRIEIAFNYRNEIAYYTELAAEATRMKEVS